MPADFHDKKIILTRLGFTNAQIDLAEYNLIKMSKLAKEKNYQNAKTHLALKTKNELLQLVLVLILENINLAEIIVFDTNREYKLSKERLADEQAKENENKVFKLEIEKKEEN